MNLKTQWHSSGNLEKLKEERDMLLDVWSIDRMIRDMESCKPKDPEIQQALDAICPGCGYGTSVLGLVLVTRAALIIDPNDERLCRDCRPVQPGRRLPNDPPASEFFPPQLDT